MEIVFAYTMAFKTMIVAEQHVKVNVSTLRSVSFAVFMSCRWPLNTQMLVLACSSRDSLQKE